MTNTEEDKKKKEALLRQHFIELLAKDLYIHKDITPEQAFDMAQDFISLQYDTDYSKTRAVKQPIYVRYIVETERWDKYSDRTSLHIDCPVVEGFETIHFHRYKGLPKDIPAFVEKEARKQIDSLLKEHNKRAGEISLSRVSQFI